MSPTAPLVLGIDIGGTSLKSAIVNTETGKLTSDVHVVPTPPPATPGQILAVVGEMIDHFSWRGPVGCGFPAIIRRGVTLSAANISPEWIGFDALSALKKLTAQPVQILNDADVAGLAEMAFGSGLQLSDAEAQVVLFLTLGTGIGSALFLKRALLPNTEFGHIEMNGMDAEDLAATVVREQENLSWEAWGARLNQYLQKMEFLLSPSAIIIGGGVSRNPEMFFPYLDLDAKLLPASMGNDAGIVGAAMCIRESLG